MPLVMERKRQPAMNLYFVMLTTKSELYNLVALGEALMKHDLVASLFEFDKLNKSWIRYAH